MCHVRDDVSRLYNKVKFFDTICRYLFWLNIVLSLLNVYFKNCSPNICGIDVKSILIVGQYITASLCVVLSMYSDFCPWYTAESERRKVAVQDGFCVPLSEYAVDNYYNNKFQPSIFKYSLNIFESVFFTKKISEEMCTGILVKGIIFLVMLLSICFLKDSWDIKLVIIQSIFSVNIFVSICAFYVYKKSVQNIFDRFMDVFTMGKIDEKSIPVLLSLSIEYETLKAFYKVRLSSRIYKKYNKELTQKWNELRSKITF